MAVDQYLLESAALDTFGGVLRFYGWSRPTLSYGYLQRVARTADRRFCAAHGVDLVRRPTGGRAVLHHQEITYSVVAAIGGFPGGGSITESYRVISEGLCAGLNHAGIAAQVSRPALPGRPNSPEPEGPRSSNPCFSSISRYELTFGGRKLLGSSQRRSGDRFLQHGSLPVVPHWDLLLNCTGQSAPQADGERMFISLGEAVGMEEQGIDALVPRLAEGMSSRLGVELRPLPLDEQESAGIDRLVQERFGTEQWNFGR